MSGIKNFLLDVEEFVNNHELIFPSMSNDEITTVLKDVRKEFGRMGEDHADDYIQSQLISY